MEMDSYKSRILDGVLVQKLNRTSWCLKLHASVSQFFGAKRSHSRVPGLKGEALSLSADRRSVRIRIKICVLYEFTHVNLICKLVFHTISYVKIRIYEFVYIHLRGLGNT
jgi:hypothetical protein